jgi:hypothetical protein
MLILLYLFVNQINEVSKELLKILDLLFIEKIINLDIILNPRLKDRLPFEVIWGDIDHSASRNCSWRSYFQILDLKDNSCVMFELNSFTIC